MKNRLLHRLYSLPLRAHLLAMAFLLALPALALIVQSGLNQRAEALRKGFSEARRTTNGIAREQLSMASNIEQLLSALEQIPDLEKRRVAATNAILSAILKKNPQYANIVIADPSGQVWASGLPMTAPFSLKGRRSFEQALATRRFASGEYTVGRVSRKPTIGFGNPIINRDGKLVGVISANIDFQQFNDSSRSATLPGGAWFSIIDRNGVIIDRSPEPETYIGTRVDDQTFQAMQWGPDRELLIAEEPGHPKRIVSYRKLTLPGEQSPYLYVRTAFPLKELTGKARRALVTNVALLSSLLLAAVAGVVFLGNLFFVRRIDRLHQAALSFAEGELEPRAGDGAGGEIGRLGEAFDAMAAKLAARREKLLESERNLHELNRDLAQKVEEETERRLSHERLLARQARLAAIGEMIGAIAHQWRQPLATLGAAVQSIRMAWERGRLDGDFLCKAEADAQKQLYHMSDTIEDFRNFFTPEKVTERFEVRGKIEEVITLVSPRFVHSGVRLETLDLAPGRPLCIKGYPNEFKQSLLNLVSNAFDAVLERGGREHPPEQPAARGVAISLSGPQDQVVVEVRDTGCGIPPEHAGKLFDPYFTTKSDDKGTGIGLYMTRLIIEESMAGELSFSSGPEGTVFRIAVARDDANEEVAGG